MLNIKNIILNNFTTSYMPPSSKTFYHYHKTVIRGLVNRDNGFYDTIAVENTSLSCRAQILCFSPLANYRDVLHSNWDNYTAEDLSLLLWVKVLFCHSKKFSQEIKGHFGWSNPVWVSMVSALTRVYDIVSSTGNVFSALLTECQEL